MDGEVHTVQRVEVQPNTQQQFVQCSTQQLCSPVPHARAAVQPDEDGLADLQQQVAQEVHHKLQRAAAATTIHEQFQATVDSSVVLAASCSQAA
jgi:hypothetical protein